MPNDPGDGTGWEHEASTLDYMLPSERSEKLTCVRCKGKDGKGWYYGAKATIHAILEARASGWGARSHSFMAQQLYYQIRQALR